MTQPLLKLTDINKSFGTTDVSMDVYLEVSPGEVLCLLGDNGAGKSTVIKILSGFHEPTSGAIEIERRGRGLQESPGTPARTGIATVHQFGGTFPLMTHRALLLRRRRAHEGLGSAQATRHGSSPARVAVREMQSLGITRITDGDRLVGGLSGGERQALAIGRAVYFGANVLILDEPTAALGVKEAAHVLRIIMQARQKGVAVILVTHNVTHAMTVGDHFAVLIHGAIAADFRKGERTREQITDLMAGGEAMAELEAEIEEYQRTHDGHVPGPPRRPAVPNKSTA